MENDKKNKVAKENSCHQNPNSMQGSEHQNQNMCYPSGILLQGNFKTRCHVPSESRRSHGGRFKSRDQGKGKDEECPSKETGSWIELRF